MERKRVVIATLDGVSEVIDKPEDTDVVFLDRNEGDLLCPVCGGVYSEDTAYPETGAEYIIGPCPGCTVALNKALNEQLQEELDRERR